jgi:thioredoxin reductase (NADPH)
MNDRSKEFDLAIVGGGVAGLTAGIYAARAGLNCAILENGLVGGIVATIHWIENYPGFPEGIAGTELAQRMRDQALRFGVEVINTGVKKIDTQDRSFNLVTNKAAVSASAVIIATGSKPKKLDIPGEDRLRGRGVSYCATCDGPLFKDRNVAVIGCGNAGLQEGHFLLRFVRTIKFIEFLPVMTADKILQERLTKEPRAEFFLNHQLAAINGTERVNSLTLQDRKTRVEKRIEVDGVFIYIGLDPQTDFARGLVAMDGDGFITTDPDLQTSAAGILAAGDVRKKQVRQIVTACAEGARAALSVYHYLEERR